MADVIEVIQPQDAIIEVTETDVVVVEVIEVGPQGPPGPVADIDAIVPFVAEAVDTYFVVNPISFVYVQGTFVYQWVIDHPLKHYPNVVAIDSSGSELIGEVKWPTPYRVTIDFNVPVAGRATLT